ncbi:MAG: hypothetical protein ACTHQM_17960 [Thermoanaerobaculia bacterium]
MDLNRIIKWVVILGLAIAAWKYGAPFVKRMNAGGTQASATGKAADSSCIRAAESASNAWGDGIGRFANPPYDTTAWSSFRSNVDAKIASAESACTCAEESCLKVRTAMSELRSLESEVDGAIRGSGSFPEDAVSRQARIDDLVNEAGDLVRAGR